MEPLINAKVPTGTGKCRHFSNSAWAELEKWSNVKVTAFTLRALKSPGGTYSELP